MTLTQASSGKPIAFAVGKILAIRYSGYSGGGTDIFVGGADGGAFFVTEPFEEVVERVADAYKQIRGNRRPPL